MKHSVPHSLGKDQARKVARAAFDSYTKRFAEYNPTTDWKTEDSAEIGFSVKGMKLTGSIDVRESEILLDMDVPFLLKPFKKQAIGKIEDEIRGWIEKAKRGEIQ